MSQSVEPTKIVDFWDYFAMDAVTNFTEMDDTVPTPDHEMVVGVYSALLVIGAIGNMAVFFALMRSRRRKSRVNLLMTHLVVADMMVTFIVIPLEIGWRTTNAWLAGNLACKFFLVLRAFGLYLSSNVLVCISLDRFFAIIYPLRLPVARKRSKMMLSLAWTIALFCSLPQSLVFRVMEHPSIPGFEQCVSFEAFSNQNQELAYNVFCLCAMYFVPLTVISVCYLCIFYEISKNSKENSDKYHHSGNSRRSDQRPLARARRRTLRMTVTTHHRHCVCLLLATIRYYDSMPPTIMSHRQVSGLDAVSSTLAGGLALWYMVDRKSAIHVSARVQDLFFLMAVSNSCMNPLVYGTFTIDPRTFTRTFRKIFCLHDCQSQIAGINRPSTINGKTSLNDGLGLNNNVRKRRLSVRFEECSSMQPSVNSDPIPFWSEKQNDTLKQAHSCEVFVLHSPPNFRS